MIFFILILSVISFSLGITAFLWSQYAIAILFSIIIPVISLYYIFSSRYRKKETDNFKIKEKSPKDNYFHPVE